MQVLDDSFAYIRFWSRTLFVHREEAMGLSIDNLSQDTFSDFLLRSQSNVLYIFNNENSSKEFSLSYKTSILHFSEESIFQQ